MYIPIFIRWMKLARKENMLRRYVLPFLAICGSLFMVYACIVGHRMANVYYLDTLKAEILHCRITAVQIEFFAHLGASVNLTEALFFTFSGTP